MKIRLLFFAALVATSLVSLSARASCELIEQSPTTSRTTDAGTEWVTTYQFECNGSRYTVEVTTFRFPDLTQIWTAIETMPNGDTEIKYGSSQGAPGSVAPWKILQEDNIPTGDPHSPPSS
jgi:hypothetical protein